VRVEIDRELIELLPPENRRVSHHLVALVADGYAESYLEGGLLCYRLSKQGRRLRAAWDEEIEAAIMAEEQAGQDIPPFESE